MHIDPLRQGLALLAAACLGLGAGLLYDLLRPPRWRLRAAAAFVLDALYCLLLGAALFLFAMSFGEGRLGIGALAAALQKALNQIECNLRIYVSDIAAYSFTGNRGRR